MRLTAEDRDTLEGLIASGYAPARQLSHARILLKADEAADTPAWPDVKIADALEVSRSTVARVRTRFVGRAWRPPSSIVGREHQAQEARWRAGGAPDRARLLRAARRQKRWSVRLLAERFVSLDCAEEPISRELVRRTLKKVPSSPG